MPLSEETIIVKEKAIIMERHPVALLRDQAVVKVLTCSMMTYRALLIVIVVRVKKALVMVEENL